ncbi:MAG: autotransporter-associated beta strand repeat-containing protein [Kiritimatiellae bacterium]|nr:autotransporter-associated beta strand repeat-containing protein [Kiritimatiellia bacterium]
MKRLITNIATAGMVLASAFVAHATTFYWDNNGSDAGFGIASGIWGSENFWSTDSIGLSTPLVSDTAADDDLYFGTDDTGLAAGTITVGGASQSFKTLTFGAASGEIALSGATLNLASPSSAIIARNVANTNVIGVVLAGDNALQFRGKEELTVTYSSTLPAHLTPVTIVTNRQLADCIAAGGSLGGTAIGAAKVATAWFFTNNGTTASCQLQILDGSWIKCVKIELRQVGADITIRTLYGAHIQDFNGIGTDFDTFVFVPPNDNKDSYQVLETILTFKPNSKLTLTGSNSYTAGTIIDKGTIEVTGSAASLPKAGGIFVNSGGELVLRVPSLRHFNHGVGENNPIYVNGGTLTVDALFNVGNTRPVIIDGGVFNSTSVENNDNGNYSGNLTLKNGALITGNKIRVGNTAANATITVSGTSASSIPAGICMVQNPEMSNIALVFNIDDVTGDDTPDLTIPGEIRDFGPWNAGMAIVKNGAGTLSLSGANINCIAWVTVNEGTLVLDNKNALNSLNNIVLNGGALEMGAFTNNVGTLTLSSNSSFVLGSGMIAFKDSSAVDWSGALNLIGTLVKQSVRFGTSNTALTHSQVTSITCNGKKVYLDGDGYLRSYAPGSIILVK